MTAQEAINRVYAARYDGRYDETLRLYKRDHPPNPQETQMSKIPPREWPVYGDGNENEKTQCAACGSTETADLHSAGHNNDVDRMTVRRCMDNIDTTLPENIARKCTTCGLVRYERPLDFDFKKWEQVWFIEEGIEALQAQLIVSRKALDEPKAEVG